jgi:DNA-binding transcriptional ArsR family regulator
MNNKILGVVLIILSLFIGISFGFYKYQAEKDIRARLLPGGECPADGPCPHALLNQLVFPTYIILVVLVFLLSLGLYLVFFEKSEKAILEEIKLVKKRDKDVERFEVLLSALNEDEKKVIKAVKEQDGIMQSTLRLRTDMSKSKLSATLKELEKKNLVKRVEKGKTKLVFLKKAV